MESNLGEELVDNYGVEDDNEYQREEVAKDEEADLKETCDLTILQYDTRKFLNGSLEAIQ